MHTHAHKHYHMHTSSLVIGRQPRDARNSAKSKGAGHPASGGGLSQTVSYRLCSQGTDWNSLSVLYAVHACIFPAWKVHLYLACLWEEQVLLQNFWLYHVVYGQIGRVGQNRIYTLYMTVYLVNPLPKLPYIHRIYIWFWPTLHIGP
jgi:hypothetical protein